jgi:hypothetical protein
MFCNLSKNKGRKESIRVYGIPLKSNRVNFTFGRPEWQQKLATTHNHFYDLKKLTGNREILIHIDSLLKEKDLEFLLTREKFEEMNQNRIIYNDDENEKNDRIIYNNDDNIKNKKYRSDQRIYRDNKKENLQNENMEEIDSDFGGNRIMDNYDLKYRIKTTYKDNNDNNKMNKDYYSLRNKKKNLNDRSYQENYNNNKLFKNMDNRDYYNNNNNSSALN